MLELAGVLLCVTFLSASSLGASAGPRLDNDKLYRYSYSTEVGLNRPTGSTRGNAGFRINSDVDISLVWRNPENQDEQLIRLQISNVRIENAVKRSRKNNIFHGSSTESIVGKNRLEALQRPFIVLWKMGKLRSMYAYKTEPATIKNLKRGVASMLMMQFKSGKMLEADASGKCLVEYKATKDQVIRTKHMETCKKQEKGFTTNSPVLGVSGKCTLVTVINLENGIIKSANTEESHTLSVNARHSAATRVMSSQSLTLNKIEVGPVEVGGKDAASVVKSLDDKLMSVGVVLEKVKAKCKGCPNLMDTWKAVRSQLEPDLLSKATAPRSFMTLLHSLRRANKEEILTILRNCSKNTLPQLVDAVTSAQTSDSLSAILEFLDFRKKEGLVLQERFLYACGFASHPTESMLQSLLHIYQGKIGSSDIKESVVIIMGALIKKLCLKGACELSTVVKVKELLLAGPDTQEESEVQMYLLALKNALLPDAVPLLTKYAESEVGAFSTIAITALQRYDTALITEEVKKTLNRLYHQNRRIYEKNVRSAAADLIMSSNPSYMEVKNLLLSIGHLPHEMNKYMLSKVQDILRFEMPACKMVRQVMKDMISHNYDRFSKSGSSSAYSGFMARNADISCTYNLDILYSGSGVLRTSNMNIYAQSNNALLHGLQVSIEAQGLESLIAATPDEGEEDLESFAGMSALLFDVQLRPVTFFKGYSDLMSKMFSMSGDPINVVKGLILLTDHSHVITLQSGIRANAEFQGSLAIDISGGMEFSLWYRESKTSVNNRGALVVIGNMTVDMDFVSAGVEVSFETEAALDFITTVQFSEYPFLVCMQMDKTTFPFREMVSTQEKLPSGQNFSSRRSREQLVPGSEFPLHQENSNMCKKVFEQSW
ncbi:microsomal triglyceride transfer protein large subunit [Triplophysa rosa]|uniref:Microsomal triglyceride transfer protein n=1 Tax=Triplophysa rosa TaxID=992332 RepID=A0A9W8C8H7_TRIRA|nr:microsomal triglyceride transfer protein large subunit [Triplophysa rosa]KAI7810597.1 Microsomal triglyceride transfer protein [Triplophysa rosa]